MNVEMDADGKCSEFKSAYIYQALFPYWNETSSSLQYIFFHFFVAVVVVESVRERQSICIQEAPAPEPVGRDCKHSLP